MEISTIGLDIARNVFQLHGVDADSEIMVRRKLRRGEVLMFFSRLSPCLVGIEACATSHHWARELVKLGHSVRLIPPSYVKPYVRRGKNDAADAAAICEAVIRPAMRFVPIKSIDQQAVLVLHKSRDLLVKQRTMLINALRCHLAEFGIIAVQKRTSVTQLVTMVKDDVNEDLPILVRCDLRPLVHQLEQMQSEILRLEEEIEAWHRSNPVGSRLATIPGVGPIIARYDKTKESYLGFVAIAAVKLWTPLSTSASNRGPCNKMARTAWALLARQEDYRMGTNEPCVAL